MMDRAELVNDGEASLRLALDGRQSLIWTAMPGIVLSVDLAAGTCEVQVSIKGVVSKDDGTSEYQPLPPLLDVPIVFPGAGGFILTMPIAVDDEVLVVFASRCIDNWWQKGDVQQPMEARMHDLSDAFAIPAPMSQPKVVSSISSTGAQLRNVAGTTYVEISPDGKIKLVSPSEIDITGNLKVSGNISTLTGDVVAGLISLKNHTHAVTTAPGTTGPALP